MAQGGMSRRPTNVSLAETVSESKTIIHNAMPTTPHPLLMPLLINQGVYETERPCLTATLSFSSIIHSQRTTVYLDTRIAFAYSIYIIDIFYPQIQLSLSSNSIH